MPETDTFWNSGRATYDVVTRRILFSFGKKIGEIVVSLTPDQPVTDLSVMSDAMLKESVIVATDHKAHDTICPELVFARVQTSGHGSAPVVLSASHRELPIWQLTDKTDQIVDDLSFQNYMKAAHAAMPTAAVAPGDNAVGFLIQEQQILTFYPLLAVTIEEDIESYKAGEGTASDVIPLLPFQS